jgi:hypothetical protein
MKIGSIPILNMMDAFDPLATPINIVLWGKPGCGKTLLASTACTPILFITFDPGGYQTIQGRPGSFVYNLAGEPRDICSTMQKIDDNAQVFNTIKSGGIRTVVLDSLTTYYWRALEYVVGKLARSSNSISMETPSMAGFGQRNQVVHNTISALMGLTLRMNLDTIVILHEDSQRTKQVPVQGQPGKFVEMQMDITPSITERMMNSVGVRVGEIWHMTALDNGQRRIELRSSRGHTPMKTRMFDITHTDCEFFIPFNARTGEGDGIAQWIERWRKEGGRRIALPK